MTPEKADIISNWTSPPGRRDLGLPPAVASSRQACHWPADKGVASTSKRPSDAPKRDGRELHARRVCTCGPIWQSLPSTPSPVIMQRDECLWDYRSDVIPAQGQDRRAQGPQRMRPVPAAAYPRASDTRRSCAAAETPDMRPPDPHRALRLACPSSRRAAHRSHRDPAARSARLGASRVAAPATDRRDRPAGAGGPYDATVALPLLRRWRARGVSAAPECRVLAPMSARRCRLASL